jgi:hypothetical protein
LLLEVRLKRQTKITVKVFNGEKKTSVETCSFFWYSGYMNTIQLPLDRGETEILAQIFAKMIVEIKVHPQEHFAFRSEQLQGIFDKLDYQIHEVGKWCDKSDCAYWIKKNRK